MNLKTDCYYKVVYSDEIQELETIITIIIELCHKLGQQPQHTFRTYIRPEGIK